VLYFHGYFTGWRPGGEDQIGPGGNFGGNSYKNCVWRTPVGEEDKVEKTGPREGDGATINVALR
jgi:hypothetical protein